MTICPRVTICIAAIAIASSGCAEMIRAQQDRDEADRKAQQEREEADRKAREEAEAQRAERDRAVREARAACYEGVGRDDLAGVVYDVLVGRGYKVTTALRGHVATEWLETTDRQSRVEARVELGRVESCKVVTLSIQANWRGPGPFGGVEYGGGGGWQPATAEVIREIEDDLYVDIHGRAQGLVTTNADTEGP